MLYYIIFTSLGVFVKTKCIFEYGTTTASPYANYVMRDSFSARPINQSINQSSTSSRYQVSRPESPSQLPGPLQLLGRSSSLPTRQSPVRLRIRMIRRMRRLSGQSLQKAADGLTVIGGRRHLRELWHLRNVSSRRTELRRRSLCVLVRERWIALGWGAVVWADGLRGEER